MCNALPLDGTVVSAIGAQSSKKDSELPLKEVKVSVTVLRHSGCHLLHGASVPCACD